MKLLPAAIIKLNDTSIGLPGYGSNPPLQEHCGCTSKERGRGRKRERRRNGRVKERQRRKDVKERGGERGRGKEKSLPLSFTHTLKCNTVNAHVTRQ